MKKTKLLIKETFSSWQKSGAARMGAALSYYTIFSLAPLLVILLSLASVFFSKPQIVSSFDTLVTGTIGAGTSAYILSFSNAITTTKLGTLGTSISVLILVLSAIGVITELNNDLDQIWNTESQTRKKISFKETLKKYFMQRVASFSLIPIGTLLFMLTIFIGLFLKNIPGFQLCINILSFLLGTILFMCIFRILPHTKLPWSELFRGSVLTAILFYIGKIFISLYIHYIAQLSIYGATGSLIAVLIWVYYSAQIFFLGACFIFVYSKRYGYLSSK